MRILLDECVTKRVRPLLAGHDVLTVREMGWGGITNGKLLTRCCDSGFDVFLTIDKNLRHQQNTDRYPVIIAVLNVNSSSLAKVARFIPAFLSLLPNMEPHHVYVIDV